MLDNIHSLSIYIPAIFQHSSYPASATDSEDDMASPTSDSRRNSRGDSGRSNSIGRRPRLLRSSKTEPSITATTASLNALATPQTSRKATDLLSQVAFSSSPPSSASPLSRSPASMYGSMSLDSMPRESAELDGFSCHLDSDRYVSFPSFDTWDPNRHEEHDEAERKSP
ncbi:hypothetical protein M406DRAFT_104650 [Cryphonectria parasitica EP155]|uniref:Uncharacterized protein n=1 Tax=Cryphonectria parasitica (strain ATCC 38755 / EP155) TaxID=660469 RepID=A0A9P4XSQ9_CRYP1|nr:uncharacterized protein M406DRAFT_104650 [Cryphonectria parasitica EP155]KAF3760223.1 hypothetical protein M406DRAFT_104650 [Cryphonectria parasitica EP155]